MPRRSAISMDPSMTEVALVILASGMSTRMGVSKSLLGWPERPLIEHQLKVALTTKLDTYVSVSAENIVLKNKLNRLGVNTLIIEDSYKGMGHSMKAITKYLYKYDGILFWAVDQPFISNEHLMTVYKTFLSNKELIVSSSSMSTPTSIPVLFPKRMFPKIESLYGDSGAKELVQKDSNKTSVFCSDFILEDMDNIKEYTQFYLKKFGRKPKK